MAREMTAEEFSQLSDDDVLRMGDVQVTGVVEDPVEPGSEDTIDPETTLDIPATGAGDSPEPGAGNEEESQNAENPETQEAAEPAAEGGEGGESVSGDAGDTGDAGADGFANPESDDAFAARMEKEGPDGAAQDPHADAKTDGGAGKADPKADPKAGTETGAETKAEKDTGDKKPEVKAGSDGSKTAEQSADSVDYKAAYDRIMAPIKAAGRTIKLDSIDDAVQLIQMGADYTRKMQALHPRLKMLKMLENNQLLDEEKLSFLIDLSKNEPSAIQKLVRDSGIDPIDIDTEAESTYRPGNHQVSDMEMAFTETVEDIASDSDGKDLIQTIHRTWDQASVDVLWNDPQILRVLKAQKQNGIFGAVTEEIERRRTLGRLPSTEPFLAVYERVGKELDAQGKLPKIEPTPQPQPAPAVPAPQERRVLETRAAAPKTISNNDKARAASPTKASSKPAKQIHNPLALSDEEFEKQWVLSKRLYQNP